MKNSKIDGHQFYNMIINACNKLENQKEFVNSLNVFPVPDGDTGTNMSMTFKGAVNEIKDMKESTVGDICKKLSKGALMGARGNSGVILSQIFRGIAKGLENAKEADVKIFAESIKEGANSAYKAVMRPTEGTILTIIRVAGEKAISSRAVTVNELLKDVCEASEDMLNKTPEMLPVLKKAKVVDAGGMGLLIILKGMLEALEGKIEADIANTNDSKESKNVNAEVIDTSDIKYGYCTEFFINTNKQVNIDEFKAKLQPHGDSMIVVGVDDVIKVHIHTNDPGYILSNALKLGELSKVKIDNMREQHRKILEKEYATDKTEEAKKYGFVSVALGEGIRDIFKNELGVDCVIEGGQTMNPSTEDILNSINSVNAENVFILPNNKNIIMAANQAAEISEKNVIVIKTKTIPQGVTAITVFNPEADPKENFENMQESIKSVTSGSITYAVRDTEIEGNEIHKDDILGLVEGKIKQVNKDVYDSCEKLIDSIVNEDSELISIYYGEDCDKEKVNELVEKLEEKYDEMDVICYEGKQPLYYFIVSVE